MNADDLVLCDAHGSSAAKDTIAPRQERRAGATILRRPRGRTTQRRRDRMRMLCLGVLAAALATTTLAAGDCPCRGSPRTAAMADNPFAAPSTLPSSCRPSTASTTPTTRRRSRRAWPSSAQGDRRHRAQPRAADLRQHHRGAGEFGRLLERVDTAFFNLSQQHRSGDAEDRDRDGAEAGGAPGRDPPRSGAVRAGRRALQEAREPARSIPNRCSC